MPGLGKKYFAGYGDVLSRKVAKTEVIINKQQLKQAVLAELLQQQQVLEKAVAVATDATTHPDAKAEGKYDTRAIVTGYLAGAQAARLKELMSKIANLQNLVFESFENEHEIRPTALVRLEGDNVEKFFLILTNIGGFTVVYETIKIHVITPGSRVGELLIDESLGSEIALGDQSLVVGSIY